MVNFFYKISSRMLMGFGSHFGSLSTRDWDSDSSAYIHSRIKNRFFIDLSITNFMLSRALKFVSFCISRGLKFLYFFDQGFGKFLYKVRGSIKFWSNNFYLVHRWVPGTLTNYKSVYGKLVKFRDSTNLLKYPNGLIFLGSNRFLASVSSEARISKLPSIGLSDIDNGYSPFSYTIPSNNKYFPIFYAYYRLFVMSTAYGWAAFKFFYSRKSKSALPRFISRIRYFYNKLPINFFFSS